MNGELVDWADATIHVGTHGLHYGSGVFEGIRAYETPRGSAVFRLTEHMRAPRDSAKLLYLDLPYSRRRAEAATWDLIGANGLPACYLRPIAYSGYGQLGVAVARQPGRRRDHGVAVGLVPRRGSACATGIRAKVSSWQRVGPNVIPHAAKATGVYINSMLAVGRGESRRLRRGDPAHARTATSPTARARASSS